MSLQLPKRQQQDLSKKYRSQEKQEQEDRWKDTASLPKDPSPNMGKNSALMKEQTLQKLKAAKVQAVSKVRHVNNVTAVDTVGGEGELEAFSSRTKRTVNPSPTKDLQDFCQPEKMDPKWFQLDQFKSICGSIHESLITIENPEFREKMMMKAQNLLSEEIQARSLLQSYMNALVMV